MSRFVIPCLLLAGVVCVQARQAGGAGSGSAQLRRTCTRCHGLDVVRAQRLSRSDWERELDKMTSMGARIRDRKLLLDYLSRRYGADASSK